MKRPLLLLTLVFTAAPLALLAAPAGKKKKNKRAQAEAPAQVVPEEPAGPSRPDEWHAWTSAAGTSVEAKFVALESGILTVETKEKKTLRFPLTKLSGADQKFALACKALVPRPPMAQEVIARAAARIDEVIAAGLKGAGQAANAVTTDAQFVRRLYLDITGRIPTAAEAEKFLADPSPDRRARLINALLDSPGYTMHLFNYFADMLRVKDDYTKGARSYVYEDWLKDQIAINRPWDAMVRDMLTADGGLTENGAAGFLLRDAQMPLDGVSNMLTTFLGADVSCAQCHDHPFAEWTQKDFYGMAAFFGAMDGYHEDRFKQIRSIVKNGVAGVDKNQAQRLLTSNAYEVKDLPQNRLRFPEDYKYDNAKPKQPALPELIAWSERDKTSPAYKVNTANAPELRGEFAKWMTHPDNPRFATAIANRLWKKVFGLAVQEPITDLDSPEGASNPELLQLITTYMRQAKFDLREYQRILFNTAAYQRQAAPEPEDAKKYRFPGPVLRRLSAEQAWDSILTLAQGPEIDSALLRRGDEQKLATLPDGRVTPEAVKAVMEKFRESGAVMMKGGGKKNKNPKVNAKALEAAYEGATPAQRAGMVLARASELPQPAPETHFLRLFGQSDRLVADTNTTDGSVPQLLQLMNGPVQEVVTSGSYVLTEAGKAKDAVRALYHAFLSRPPTPDEMEKSTAALAGGLSTSDLAWVLLNSREFLFIP